MDDTINQLFAEVISAPNQNADKNPSDLILISLRDLANKSSFREMSECFSAFRKVHPHNAFYVSGRIPPVISNALCRKFRIGAKFLEMTKSRPDWSDEIAENIDHPDGFVAVIEGLEADLTKHLR